MDIGGDYAVILREDGFSPFWIAGLELSPTENDEFAIAENLSLYRAPCKDVITVPQLLPTVSHTVMFSVLKRHGLNYHGSTVPFYSAAGGRLNYIFNATSIFDSMRRFCLYIFDNSESYLNFIDGGSTVGSILDTGCLESETNYTDVSILINTSGFYYVAASMHVEESQPVLLNYSVTPELQVYDFSVAATSECTVSHDFAESSCLLDLPEHSLLSNPRICVYCQSKNYTNLSVVTFKRWLNRGTLLFLALTVILVTLLMLSCGAYMAPNLPQKVPIIFGKVVSKFLYDLHHDQVCVSTFLLMLSDAVILTYKKWLH